MTRFRSFGVAAVLAALLAGGAAFAQAPDGPRGRGFGRFGGPGAGLPLRELNLTEAQREQIRTLVQQHQERLRTDIFALLTPEQQAKANQLQAERQQRREQRRQQREQRQQPRQQ